MKNDWMLLLTLSLSLLLLQNGIGAQVRRLWKYPPDSRRASSAAPAAQLLACLIEPQVRVIVAAAPRGRGVAEHLQRRKDDSR